MKQAHDPYPVLHHITPKVDTEGSNKVFNVAVIASPKGARLGRVVLSDVTTPGAAISVSARLGPGSLRMLILALQRALDDLDAHRDDGAEPGEAQRGVPRGRTAP